MSTGLVYDATGNYGVELLVTNANNHQTTWGVLGAAVSAVGQWMLNTNGTGTVSFEIVDGTNEVGMGQVQVQ